MRDEGAGVLIYEQQEGRGIGLMAKLQAYALQDSGLDTVEANERLGFKADQREFLMPVEILKALDIQRVRLLSNNPDKVAALERAGIRVTERVPCEVAPTEHTEDYLKDQAGKIGTLVHEPARAALDAKRQRSLPKKVSALQQLFYSPFDSLLAVPAGRLSRSVA